MIIKERFFQFSFTAGALFCLLSVILGALSSHALKLYLSSEQLASFSLAASYQFFHGLSLLILAYLPAIKSNITKFDKAAIICLFAGNLLFSGSIYLLVLLKLKFLGPVTPLGGSLLIIGWVLIVKAGFCLNSHKEA